MVSKWQQQFVLIAGLLLVVIQFWNSGQATSLWNAIWSSTPAASSQGPAAPYGGGAAPYSSGTGPGGILVGTKPPAFPPHLNQGTTP